MKLTRDGLCFFVVTFLISASMTMMVAGPTRAETPYYQNKIIEITVQSRVGGGTDTAARIAARFLPKYLPGNPTITLRNVPGGGGSIANNVFYESGKPDGLHLLQAGSSSVSMQLRSRDIAKYDLMKLEHIAHIVRGGNILLVRKEALPRLTDPTAPPVVCGTKEGEETWQAMTMWGKKFLGWNIRWIPGYAGSSDFALAFNRSEIDMMGTSNTYLIKQYLADGKVALITQMGAYGLERKFVRRTDFPNVPTFVETLGKKKPTGIAWQAYTAFIGANMIDKFMLAPRRTPKKYVAMLTDAYSKMSKDPKFDDMVKKTLADDYAVGVGSATTDVLKMVLEAPQAALDYTKDLQLQYGIIAKK